MQQAVAGNIFPGGVLVFSVEGNIAFFEAYGYANLFCREGMSRDTVFDLASLTKPLATALAAMALIQQGKLTLDQEIGELLPDTVRSEKARIRIRHLLAHTAGFADYRPFFHTIARLPWPVRKQRLRNLLLLEPLLSAPGERVLYSDLGFMLMEWVLEAVSGRPLDRLVAETVYRPLQIEDLFFVDRLAAGSRTAGYAATELCPWRKRVLQGLVHDENTYVVGGIAGHAGLFGNARSVHRLLWALLCAFHEKSCGNVFPKALLDVFFQRQDRLGRTLGFDVPAMSGSSAGRYFSRHSVGHLGFTGTSFWMDLEQQVIVILLTNRVHPTRRNERIKAFRPVLHDAVMRAVGKAAA